MAVAKSERLNANVAKMAKGANFFAEFALFASFALSLAFNFLACQATLLSHKTLRRLLQSEPTDNYEKDFPHHHPIPWLDRGLPQF
jgi:hypothetical protein